MRSTRVCGIGEPASNRIAGQFEVAPDAGAIVNVGSALAFIGIPLQSAYCSSKFACRGFFESVRAELLHEASNVRISMVHMPAVNTTQFGWCKNAMARRPQPVPPIYQPEVVAPFIVQAARDGRRSTVVGSWKRLVVAAGRLTPGLGNQYAAAGAWDTQLTDQPADPNQPVNLWHPVDGEDDRGTRGTFDAKAGGFLDPSFLSSLPSTAATFGSALGRVTAEKARWLRRTDPAEQRRVAVTAAAVAVAGWLVRRAAS